MMLRRPVAMRPFALITLAVLAAHLLVLGPTIRHVSEPPASLQTLVTRVIPPSTRQQPTKPPAPTPVVREPAARPPPQPARPVPVAPTARTVDPPAESIAAASPLPPASAPAPLAEAGPASPYAIPGSVRLRYAVTGKSRGQLWNVDGELLWRHDGTRYEASLDYSGLLLPSRSQHSTGLIGAEGLAPLRFSDTARGSEQATHFERGTGTLIFSNNAPQQPLAPGTQDRLSVFLQLAATVGADPAKFPPGTSITVPTAGTRDAQPWLFTVEADAALDLPGGSVATRKLVRKPRGEYDIRVDLWLGTAMDYVPVRIRLTQANGDYVDQQWASTDRP